MHKVKTLISLDIIENTLRGDSLFDVKASNFIVTIAINHIKNYTKDKYVRKTIQVIFRNWKIYSGQMGIEGKRPKQNQELELMFIDCENIRDYLKNPTEKTKRKN